MRLFAIVVVMLGAVACGGSGSDSSTFKSSIGACNTPASFTCLEHGPDADLAYSRSYCENAQMGTWMPSCPTANRIAACTWPSSAQYWYAGYGDLAGAQSACQMNGTWHLY
jgi:hypothetical protein